MESYLIFCLFYYLLCRRENNHFDVNFRRIGPVLFLSKYGKDAVREVRNGRKGVYSRQSRHLFLQKYYNKSTFTYLYIDMACKQICFPPRKGISRRNEGTGNIV